MKKLQTIVPFIFLFSISTTAFAIDVKELLANMEKNGYSKIEEDSLYNESTLEVMRSKIKSGETKEAEKFTLIMNSNIYMYKFQHKDGTKCYGLSSTFLANLDSLSQIVGLDCK